MSAPLARLRRWTEDYPAPVTDRVIVVLECPNACKRYHHPVVDLTDAAKPVVEDLDDNCACGAMLDTPAIVRDLIGTARRLIVAGYHVATKPS